MVGMSRLPSGEAASEGPPAFSLSPGPIAMAGPGAGYVFDYTQVGPVEAERLTATVEEFLERQDNPDLTLATLREFRMAYAADIVEKSTGKSAFGLMIGKAALQVSPKAGPNVFWNTKYGSMIAEIGGGYGMVGRLLPQALDSNMVVTEAEARALAEEAVKEANASLELANDTATFYGFYEFVAVLDGEPVGEVDVDGYSGQVWYKDWGEPQLGVQDVLSSP